ncbi:glycosyltransferase family 2 protein [Motilimonas pumila]|uniref:Glycosyltransferase family 2 protein n=1 Tax=Motilimonas pumila TaxID=2303987 RepID=A0A418YDS7_9GAMM|nr:glycosyltransferase family A protein [Motilimonas pumila]RJG42713.1 glycosyltransferase family 2 protein [Motilimonas pumila]
MLNQGNVAVEHKPLVSVVTRTKNRPLLLQRVFECLLQQSFSCFEWVVVNDGGISAPVTEICHAAIAKGLTVTCITHETSKGMEAASNVGVKAAMGEFIVILDDDDTWRPTFLEKMVSVLNANPFSVGVVSQSNKIVEEVSETQVTTLSDLPLNPDLKSISLADLTVQNQFQTNAFLYRKHFYEEVGGYNEDMPVLGDWDFNLRMVLLGEIVVLPAPLANYHHRASQVNSSSSYDNSQINLHHYWDAKYRNDAIRKDIKNNCVGLGFLLAQGKQSQVTYQDLEKLRIVGAFYQALYGLFDKLGINRLYRALFNKG